MRLENLELAVLSKSHRIAMAETARCVLYGYGYGYGQARTLPTTPLFAFGSTDIALRGAQPLPRLRAKAQQQQEQP